MRSKSCVFIRIAILSVVCPQHPSLSCLSFSSSTTCSIFLSWSARRGRVTILSTSAVLFLICNATCNIRLCFEFCLLLSYSRCSPVQPVLNTLAWCAIIIVLFIVLNVLCCYRKIGFIISLLAFCLLLIFCTSGS